MVYIVACGQHKFFSGFSGGRPMFTTKVAYARRFDYEEMAQYVAQRCSDATGSKFKVQFVEEGE